MKRWLLMLMVMLGTTCWAQAPLDQSIDFVVTDVSVPEAVAELSLVSGTSIAYSSNFFDPEERISLVFIDTPIRDILTEMLKGTPINFKEIGDGIVLFKDDSKPVIVSGYVLDQQSGEALVSAAVYCPNLQTGTLTNEYGFFSLSLPPGEQEVHIRYIGYFQWAERLKLGRDRRIEVNLAPDFTLSDVVITPELKDNPLPTTEPGKPVYLTSDFVKASPSLGGEEDFVRAAQMTPGVQGGVDGMAGLHVRGGDPGQNLMLLDGVPIFIPFHLLGVYSVYNSQTIKSTKLIKGGFSARYGGRASSIFDVRTREGDLQNWHGAAQVNLINGNAFVEGPLQKGKGSFLVSGRRAPAAFLLNPVFDRTYFPTQPGVLETKFYDLNAKVNYSFGENDRMYLSFFTGKDEFGKEEEGEDEENETESEQEIYWSNTTAALRWNHIYNEKLFSNTTFTYSRFSFQYTTFDRFIPVDTSQPTTLYFVENRSFNTNLGLQTDYDLFLSAQHNLRFGGGLSLPRFNPVLAYLDHESSSGINVDSVDAGNLSDAIEGETKDVLEGNVYVEDQITLGNTLKANLGVRGTFFYNDDHLYLRPEPRVSLHFHPAEKYSLFLSGSRMIQYLHLVSNTALRLPNDLWLASSDSIQPQDVWIAEIGAGAKLSETVDFSVTGYYKYMQNLYTLPDSLDFLTSADLATPETYLKQGTGVAYGTEFQVVYSGKKSTGMFSYTLAKSERQFDDINAGIAFPQAFDRRHQFKAFFSQKLGSHFQLSSNFVLFSGSPRLNLTSLENGVGFSNLELHGPGQKNQVRSPAYHRLDINLTYRATTGPLRHRFKVGVYNVYDRKNIAYYQQDSDGNLEAVKAVGLTPSVQYEIRF